MAKGYTFLDFAKEVLENSKKPLAYMDIWQTGVDMGLDKKLGTSGKTPTASLQAAIYVDMRYNKDSIFYIHSKKPTLFWLKNKNFLESNLPDSENLDTKNTQEYKFNERDLHPLLVKFANTEFSAYCKSIYHEKSKKSVGGKDKWIHPDIVGVHFTFMDDYKPETLEIMKGATSEFELFSFELKIRLDWSNYKECYFQAVSNSSWANAGYLVVFEKIDDELLKELARLNNSFGIGVIDLSLDDEVDKVVLESKKREIDFETLDMLVEKNKDFKKFIKSISEVKKVNRVWEDDYDPIYDDEEMEKYMRDNKIV